MIFIAFELRKGVESRRIMWSQNFVEDLSSKKFLLYEIYRKRIVRLSDERAVLLISLKN